MQIVGIAVAGGKRKQDGGALSTSVEKLALSMESMVKDQEKQGKRLEALESRDGEMWRKVVGYVVTVVVGAFLGYVLTKMGL